MEENRDLKKNVGRKGKYEDFVKPRFKEIEKWLNDGLTDKEIMKKLHISKNAFYSYKTKYKEFNDLIKNKRMYKVEEIKNALFKRAIGYEYEETKITTTEIQFDEVMQNVLLECGFDVEKLNKPKLIKKEVTKKITHPDPASCLILLKHWDKENEWTGDPQILKIKKEELKIKKETSFF